MNEGAQKFIDNMAQKALDFLGDSDLDREKKKSQFRHLLQDSFDMDTIGRFSLGRYWRVATPEQRQEYLKLFNDMVVDVYSSRFDTYKGQKFETRGFHPDGEKDTIVMSFILSDEGPEVQVDWRVRYKNGKYKIVDIIVEGVSMSVTQRSDFSAVIQRGGGDVGVLLDHLKKQQNL
ncbi:MAG: ABC transporter substrate-binding protein [Rhodospirillales bacterium]|nr:ABC transporter substrate-binding protein [Rhodospirillales bacterium]